MADISLHIGINKYLPAFYGGGIDLNQCVNDAQRLYEYATKRGYSALLVTDYGATLKEFSAFMADAAKTLKKGDRLFITNSSHGTFEDIVFNGEHLVQNAICFTDGILWDYQLRELLKKFKTGVTVIKLSDCCFSESNWRFLRHDGEVYNGAKTRFVTLPKAAKPPKPTSGDKRQIKAFYFDYASSNAFQPSYEDERGGVFTTAVLTALKTEPNLSYYQLWKRASAVIGRTYPQTPIFENVRAAKLTGNQFLT